MGRVCNIKQHNRLFFTGKITGSVTPEALHIQVTNGRSYYKNKVDEMHFDVKLALQVQQNLISIF